MNILEAIKFYFIDPNLYHYINSNNITLEELYKVKSYEYCREEFIKLGVIKSLCNGVDWDNEYWFTGKVAQDRFVRLIYQYQKTTRIKDNDIYQKLLKYIFREIYRFKMPVQKIRISDFQLNQYCNWYLESLKPNCDQKVKGYHLEIDEYLELALEKLFISKTSGHDLTKYFKQEFFANRSEQKYYHRRGHECVTAVREYLSLNNWRSNLFPNVENPIYNILDDKNKKTLEPIIMSEFGILYIFPRIDVDYTNPKYWELSKNDKHVILLQLQYVIKKYKLKNLPIYVLHINTNYAFNCKIDKINYYCEEIPLTNELDVILKELQYAKTKNET